MGVNLKGGNNSAGLANVSATYELNTVTPQTETDAGFVQVSSEVDAGSVLGTRTVRAMEVSDDYRVRVGMDQTLFNLAFEGAIVPQALVQQNVATMTVAQASGFLSLNSGNATASGNMAAVRTYRHFPTYGSYPTFVSMWIREANYNATNCLSEWGVFQLATTTSTAAPTDGVFWRRLSGGALKAVINYAGVETEYTVDTTNVPARDGVGAYDPTESNHFLISYHIDTARFWINDIAVAEIKCPGNQPTFAASPNLPVHFRVVNSGVASAGRRIEVGFINVGNGDQNTNKPWSHVMVGSGGGAYQIQTGIASGPTCTRGTGATGWPTSATARIAGTWTATTAPALNSLGGLYTTPAISTLTSEADYPVFSYLVPAGTNAIAGKTLYITGVRIHEAFVTTAASTNAVNIVFGLGIGGTSSATTATESGTVVAARIVPLGSHGFSATAAVGDMKSGFEVSFPSPLVVPAGMYATLVARICGTVTSNTLVIQSGFTVNGYFE